jgi:two-component system, LytTR family, sensor kinase
MKPSVCSRVVTVSASVNNNKQHRRDAGPGNQTFRLCVPAVIFMAGTMNRKTQRYSFWRVLWVIIALYAFFSLLGIIVMSISPVNKNEFNWQKILTLHYLISQGVSIIFSTVFYYFTLNSFYRLMASRSATIHYVRTIALAILGLAAYYTFNYYVFSPQKMGIKVSDGKSDEFNTALMLFSYVMSSVFFLCVSLLVAYLTFLRDEKKQRKILEEQKMQLEVEKSQANFNFLKAQINPHFLHNTLNFLYAKSLPYSPELSEGILTLSDIMRYALSEGNTRDGRALLKDEIEHVRNVIKINQLRFSNNLHVQFDVEGMINGATIIPFVLITLVENAFKHGDLKSTDYPIMIKVKVEDHKLRFFCRNRKKAGPKELSTGIGLDNIKKRLELAYGKNYLLNIKDEAEFYTTELTIDTV